MSPADRRAIEALRAKGAIVSIATGRMYSGTRDVARTIGVRGPVACIDGSHIVDASTDEDLVCHGIEPRALERIGLILDSLDAATVVFSSDVIYYDRASHPYLPFLTIWSDRVVELDRVLPDERWGNEAAVNAAVAIAARDDVLEARDRIHLELAGQAQTIAFGVRGDEVWGIVIRASGVSKGTALAWIARHHDVPIEQTVAVGDWLNDIPMLRAAGRSYCMAQAPAEVIEAASERLEADGWNGGGIAEAAERSGML